LRGVEEKREKKKRKKKRKKGKKPPVRAAASRSELSDRWITFLQWGRSDDRIFPLTS
jgi:hypothetical protein